jgi:plastocyanin
MKRHVIQMRVTMLSLVFLLPISLALSARANSSPHVRVHIKDMAFIPKVIHVRVGSTVTWVNEDDVAHTVTSGNGSDDAKWVSSPLITTGKTFNVTFSKVGSFPYYCKPHFYDESMHGTVIVEK